MKWTIWLASFLFSISAWATQVATPTLSLAAGQYQGAQSVTITCATAGATITCTTDGTALTSPTAFVYSGPLTINQNTVLKCIGTLSGDANSTVVQAIYIITRTKAMLLADLAARPFCMSLVRAPIFLRYETIGNWAANTVYSKTTISPSVANGCSYSCTTAGTSGTIEPIWPTTVGQTVIDGTVTWTCVKSIGHYQQSIVEISPAGWVAMVRNIYFLVVAEGTTAESAAYDNQTCPQAQISATQ